MGKIRGPYKKKPHKVNFILDSDEHGEYCVIPVGIKKVYYAKVDVCDYEKVNTKQWYHSSSHRSTYAICYDGYQNGRPINTSMHRVVLGLDREGEGKRVVDHKDGDGLNNRRYNLRIGDQCKNQWNKRRCVNKVSSKYKGVYKFWGNYKNRRQLFWLTKIYQVGIGHKYIGMFKPKIIGGVDYGEIVAAKAYDRVAAVIFGCFACLNFPEDCMSGHIIKVLSEKESKRAKKMIRYCGFDDKNNRLPIAIISQALANSKIEDLRLMCIYLQCNISQLCKMVRNSAFSMQTDNLK